MRWENDEKLAKRIKSDVDLILGGHDHDYEIRRVIIHFDCAIH